MVQRGRHYREPFDADRDFVAAHTVLVQGQSFGPGKDFDKTLVVSVHRLRQLYDQRAINMRELVESKAKPRRRLKIKRYRLKPDFVPA